MSTDDKDTYAHDTFEMWVNETIEGMGVLADATGEADRPFAPLALQSLSDATREELRKGARRLLRALGES